MTRALRILTLSSDPDLIQELHPALAERGHSCKVASSVQEAEVSLAEGAFDALLIDESVDGLPCANICGALPPAILQDCVVIALIRPGSSCSFSDLREAGAQEFASVPVHVDLLLLRLEELGAQQTSPAGTAGFVSHESFIAETSRRIPAVRNSDRHLSVIVLSLHTADAGFDWVGMEERQRASIEALLIQSMQAAFAAEPDAESLGLHAADLVMAWVRPDRIAILAPGLRRVQDVAKVGGRFQERLTLHSEVSKHMIELSSSLGIAACPEDGVSATDLTTAAQRAADRAREDGRNCLAFHTHAMGQWAFERLTLERSLSDALENGELRVFYQPRIDIRTRKILGMEALVRWVHPQLGMVSPGQFIPLAEETGLITPIGEWVLAESCRQNRAWREAGLPPIRVSVNLSPVQFRNPKLHEIVVDALNSSGLDCDGLELEVTESMLMNDPKVTIATLRKLKEAGLKISIDDFGTGYSSLSYLKQFPIDSLKIDRSFVRDVTSNPDDAAIATAIILMGHSLKLNVVAEGVETESQLAFLRVLQCNEIQGFLFSPPVPAEKAAELLSKGFQPA